MAITTTLLNISTTRVDTAVPKLTQAALILKDTTQTVNGSSVTEVSEYTLGTSTIEPLTVTVRRVVDSKKGTVHYALKVSTIERGIDADGIVVLDEPVEAGCWVTRALTPYDITDANIEALIGNVYALYHASIDGGKIPTTTLLNLLRLGVTKLY
jgi:hypothetical protein